MRVDFGFRVPFASYLRHLADGLRSALTSLATILTLFLGALVPQYAWAQGDALSPEPAVETGGFWAVISSGGWIGGLILFALLMLSLMSVYLIIEQVMVLRKQEVMPTGLAEEVRQLLSQGRLPDADAACRQRPSPLAFVILSGLSELDYGWTAMEKAMEDAISEQAAKLYRKIEYLSVIGNLAPMCGLLGTVTGMIFAFQQVAISQGTAGASDLAEGIYSALVTTVAGLVVAIPSLGAFAVFRNRIDQLIAEAAYLAQHVFAPVRRRAIQTGTRPKSAGPAPLASAPASPPASPPVPPPPPRPNS
ncbi:MotA/TolQ/ExbB proton channel family protein [Aureliella helgolandensis]|nr:MotA/TolQ/ExbB proton channel family protein [Aureliella helgolandensis]